MTPSRKSNSGNCEGQQGWRRRNDIRRWKSNNERGIAVVLALATMLLVVTAALELHIGERESLMDTAIMRDRVSAGEMAASGVHLAMAMLVKDRLESETDSLQEDWADAETLVALIGEIPFEEGKLELKISDELSKIQINALVQFPEGQQFNTAQVKLWSRFGVNLISAIELLEGADEIEDKEETDPLTIINSLKDWLDSGDDDAITGLSGAETDYYEDLDPPYACKNGPFDHLSEVRLVKGITPEIFMGAGGAAGLGQYVTVYGAEKSGDNKFTFPGKININTAELPVLTALLPEDVAEFAPLIIEYREATSGTLFTNDLTKTNWYRNVPGLAEADIDENLVTITSDTFRIEAVATLNNIRVMTTAVVQRVKPLETDPWQCKVLNWKTE